MKDFDDIKAHGATIKIKKEYRYNIYDLHCGFQLCW
jgi:hypothetical protein